MYISRYKHRNIKLKPTTTSYAFKLQLDTSYNENNIFLNTLLVTKKFKNVFHIYHWIKIPVTKFFKKSK